MSNFQKWFQTFLDEKDIPYQMFEIEHDGEMNLIDTDVVIEAIMNCNPTEQAQIKNIIVKLDFANAPIIPFFKHLAAGLVANR